MTTHYVQRCLTALAIVCLSVPLMADFFVPDDDTPPPGVTVQSLPSVGAAQKTG